VLVRRRRQLLPVAGRHAPAAGRRTARCDVVGHAYNKTYLDLASQLRLFVKDDVDLGIRPERLLRDMEETEFIRRHQCPLRSLAAFEKSLYADAWRELMRLYLVRRTRTFIQDNYAETDCQSCAQPIQPTEQKCPKCGKRKSDKTHRYLTFEDGSRSYFPTRVPKTLKFTIDDENPSDQ
jgi:hypothetical protein